MTYTSKILSLMNIIGYSKSTKDQCLNFCHDLLVYMSLDRWDIIGSLIKAQTLPKSDVKKIYKILTYNK